MSRPVSGPVVIGGVGGSGTRVVAEMVRRLGVHLGDDLNDSSDNLWATLLLRRPVWFVESRSEGDREIFDAFAVLDRATQGCLEVDDSVERLLTAAEQDLRGQGLSEAWTRARVESLLTHGSSGTGRTPWGWKEPNSHVYVEHLARHFGDARYVHVIRHGLDMAFSTNQWQVRTWGPLFGIPSTDFVDPVTSLDYWLRANTAAIDAASRSLGPRFLLVGYEALCANPGGEARRLASFLGAETSPLQLTKVAELAGAPCSSERWRRFGTDPFRPDQLEGVVEFGFGVG